MGVAGAAVATVLAQLLATGAFVLEARKRPELFAGLKPFAKPDWAYLKGMVIMGLPMAVQSALFTSISMGIARIISAWGPLAIAVQKVGSQIESISWMTAGGFQSAMSAFSGQNYGAKKGQRVYRGYYVGLGIVSCIGLTATAALIFAARPLISIFLHEPEAIALGVAYLRILGISQLPQTVRSSQQGPLSAWAGLRPFHCGHQPQSVQDPCGSDPVRDCPEPGWGMVGYQYFLHPEGDNPQYLVSALYE